LCKQASASFNRNFFYFAGVLLLLTSAAKLISATGSAHILENQDPILQISFRRIFEFAGSLELVIALVCFFGKRLVLKAGLIAWLSTCFFIYRLGLNWVGYTKPCSCLGNLTDSLHIAPDVADLLMKFILAVLFFGSYSLLFWLWFQKNKLQPVGAANG
jgi:hypothetical protein